jgi:excisionase family DNA binding protein
MKRRAMASLSLREAAEATGTSKSTLFRAVRAGRLSATRDDDGQFWLDPAELFRVYEPKKTESNAPTRTETQSVVQDATVSGDVLELRIRVAEEMARAKLAEERVADLKAMLEEMRQQRDRWQTQAERLAIAPPTPVTVTVPPAPTESRRGWWPFRRSA